MPVSQQQTAWERPPWKRNGGTEWEGWPEVGDSFLAAVPLHKGGHDFAVVILDEYGGVLLAYVMQGHGWDIYDIEWIARITEPPALPVEAEGRQP